MAAIVERPPIDTILTHLGLWARAPPRSPARGPGTHLDGAHALAASTCSSTTPASHCAARPWNTPPSTPT